MSFDDFELSADQGAPVELYVFARGSKLSRFTSAAVAQTVYEAVGEDIVEVTYTPAPIRRTSIEQGSELSRIGLRLTVPRDFPIAQMYIASPPTGVVAMTLRQIHATDSGQNRIVIWTGRVLSVAFAGAQAEIRLESLQTGLQRVGLRRAYQGPCPHVLYGRACGVDPDDHRVTLAVSAVDGLEVVADGLDAEADGWWEGGVATWDVEEGVTERRFIAEHTGDTVKLDTPPAGLEASTEVAFLPGCDHSLATCHSKFDNARRYGGMPFIPKKNPFRDAVY